MKYPVKPPAWSEGLVNDAAAIAWLKAIIRESQGKKMVKVDVYFFRQLLALINKRNENNHD